MLTALLMVSLGEELVSGLMVLASEIEDGVSMSMKFGSLAFALRVRVEAESGLELEKMNLQFFVSRVTFLTKDSETASPRSWFLPFRLLIQ